VVTIEYFENDPLGHSIGLVFYLCHKKEIGDVFIKYSSRTLLCTASGAVYGVFGVSKSLEELFGGLKLSKEIVICSVMGFIVGVLFDYSSSFEKTIKIFPKSQEKSILFENKIDIVVNFPFGIIKNIRKITQKPQKKMKYFCKLGLNVCLYAAFCCGGLYYCLKVQKNLVTYLTSEIKRYAVMGTCLLLLFV